MSVSYSTCLYVGIFISEHLDVKTEKEGYYKFDTKSGKPTNEWVDDLTTHIITFGNKKIKQEFDCKNEFELEYEIIGDDLLGIAYGDSPLEWYHDYENVESSVIGIDLFDTGDLSYGGGEPFALCVSEVQEKVDEVKQLFKQIFDLDVEPRLIVKSYAG